MKEYNPEVFDAIINSIDRFFVDRDEDGTPRKLYDYLPWHNISEYNEIIDRLAADVYDSIRNAMHDDFK